MTPSTNTSTPRKSFLPGGSSGGRTLRRITSAILAPLRLIRRYCSNKRRLISIETSKPKRYEAFCHLMVAAGWEPQSLTSYLEYSIYENVHCCLNWEAPTFQETNRKLIGSLLNWRQS